jgi:hypothetical protein
MTGCAGYVNINVDGRILPLEVVSEPQMWFDSETTADEKAQHALSCVSISRRSAMTLSGLR